MLFRKHINQSKAFDHFSSRKVCFRWCFIIALLLLKVVFSVFYFTEGKFCNAVGLQEMMWLYGICMKLSGDH